MGTRIVIADIPVREPALRWKKTALAHFMYNFNSKFYLQSKS